MEVLEYPHKLLRTKTYPIKNFGRPIKELGDKMLKVMVTEDGIGLAATQVGFLIRLFVTSVIDDGIICNPEWKPTPSAFDYRQLEGCLSFPGWFAPVRRYDAIIAEWRAETGEKRKKILKGFVAQVFQHETEHLDGILMIDHLSEAQKKTIENQLRRK